MNFNEVLKQINEIFMDVLDNENIVLNENTTADDIDEWDSLSHMMLVVAIEKHFKIKCTLKEILSWKNIGDTVTTVIEKRS